VILFVAALLLTTVAETAFAQRAAKLHVTSGIRLDRRQPTFAFGLAQTAVAHAAVRPMPAPSVGLRAGRRMPLRLSWSATDVALAGGFAASLLIDAGQTRGLARGGWSTYHESNPILGPRPSVGQLDTYTAVMGVAVLGAAAAAPPRVRTWILGAAFALEAITISRTTRSGVAIRLP
jgi:hypothetical protein